MSAQMAILLAQLLAQYGPTVVNDVLTLGKSEACPTADELQQLHTLLKPAESYFSAAPAAGSTVGEQAAQ